MVGKNKMTVLVVLLGVGIALTVAGVFASGLLGGKTAANPGGSSLAASQPMHEGMNCGGDCNGSHDHGQAEADKKAGDNGKTGDEKQAVVYTCPMHPEVISDKPGQCPKCGMNLEPKK